MAPWCCQRSFPLGEACCRETYSPQGCFLSLPLRVITKRHDDGLAGGKPMADLIGRMLEYMYADDAALVDATAAQASARASSIQVGAVKDADMVLSIPKTKAMHVQRQEEGEILARSDRQNSGEL
jgi:hypothetical protein